jgi:hypothetical protein
MVSALCKSIMALSLLCYLSVAKNDPKKDTRKTTREMVRIQQHSDKSRKHYKRMWVFSQKRLEPHAAHEINFMVSAITMYNMSCLLWCILH